jgi:hypothetical protein
MKTLNDNRYNFYRKNGDPIVKKRLILSLLAIYLIIVLTYIFYLPQYYNQARAPKIAIASNSIHLHKDYGFNNSYLMLQRTFKSVPENNRRTVINLPEIETIVFLLVSGVTLPGLIRKPAIFLRPFFYIHQYAYLSFCSLRI